MKQVIVFFFFLISICHADAQGEVYDLKDFNKLSVSTNIEMELIKASETKMEIEITRGDRSELRIEEENNRLRVYIKGENTWGSSKTKANIKLYFKELNDLSVSASARVFSDDIIKSDDFEADVSSSGRLSFSLDANSLDSNVSSSGSLKIKGNCKEIDVSVSSSGSFEGKDLMCETADADASSSGSIKLWVTKHIEASTSSSGSISYKGNPSTKDIDKSRSGGSIRSIDNN